MKSKNLTYLMTHPLILLWFMILGAIMMFLLGRQGHNRYLQALAKNRVGNYDVKRSIGQIIRISGSVKGAYGFGMLQLLSDQGEEFIIKSTSININQLTGNITIQGVISEYNGIVPVVNVMQYDSDNITDGSQFWYSSSNGVVFRPGYDVEITSSGNLISIVDPIVNKEVIKIRSFPCVSGSGLMDECSIESSNWPSFTSSYRHKFIQGDGLWYVFGDNIGYRIRTSDQYYVNVMSQYFDLMNTRLMADLVRKELKTKCIGPQTNVIEYVSHRTREQNGNIFVIIRGLSNQKKLAVCQLKMIVKNNILSFQSIATIPVEQ